MDHLLPPTHGSNGWTETCSDSVTYLPLITNSVKKREGSGVRTHTHMTHGEREIKMKRLSETQSLFPQINTNGKRQSVPLMLHHDKVLHKFI